MTMLTGLIAGYVDKPDDRRYCFQTTYLNERNAVYASQGRDQRLIEVLTNPRSVVRSMLHIGSGRCD
jgi:hypothetical protein